MADDFAAFARKLDNIGDKLARSDMRDRLVHIGDVAVKAADEVLRQDTGGSMRNWRRGRPIPLANSRRINVSAATVTVAPRPRARGPVLVLSVGRKAGTAKSGRKVSASRGRGTWDRGTALMTERVPAAADKDVQEILRSQLGG